MKNSPPRPVGIIIITISKSLKSIFFTSTQILLLLYHFDKSRILKIIAFDSLLRSKFSILKFEVFLLAHQ